MLIFLLLSRTTIVWHYAALLCERSRLRDGDFLPCIIITLRVSRSRIGMIGHALHRQA
jgi:hypothetical protein